MLRQLPWEMHSLVCSPLGYHHNAPDLLHLGIIRRAHSIKVTCNLGTQANTYFTSLEETSYNHVKVGGQDLTSYSMFLLPSSSSLE